MHSYEFVKGMSGFRNWPKNTRRWLLCAFHERLFLQIKHRTEKNRWMLWELAKAKYIQGAFRGCLRNVETPAALLPFVDHEID